MCAAHRSLEGESGEGVHGCQCRQEGQGLGRTDKLGPDEVVAARHQVIGLQASPKRGCLVVVDASIK